jgi:hypothetical protein
MSDLKTLNKPELLEEALKLEAKIEEHEHTIKVYEATIAEQQEIVEDLTEQLAEAPETSDDKLVIEVDMLRNAAKTLIEKLRARHISDTAINITVREIEQLL